MADSVKLPVKKKNYSVEQIIDFFLFIEIIICQ